MEVSITSLSCFLTSADFCNFNIHIDNPEDKTGEFCSLFETFDLLEHVKGPAQTHTGFISKCVDISNIINRNINSSRALFITVEEFLSTRLAADFPSCNRCHEITFFCEKTENIRLAVNSSRPLLQSHRNSLARLSAFNAITTITLEDVVAHLNSSTCCLTPCQPAFSKLFSVAWKWMCCKLSMAHSYKVYFSKSLKTSCEAPSKEGSPGP